MTAGIAAPLQELLALRARVPAPQPAAHASGMHGGRHAGRLGRGMEFAESRPYRAGDDVRHIDWRQTARHGRAYTKLFREEHERPVHLLVDLGASMRFGTRGAFKSVVAARAAALLAWQAAAAGGRVGGLVCGAVQQQVRPQGRERGALALLRQLAAGSQAAPLCGDGLGAALTALARTLRPGSIAVLLSDFDGLDERMARDIGALALRNDVALVHVHDAFEAEAPPPGIYPVSDGQRDAVLDLRGAAARAAHAAPFAARRARLEQLARGAHLRLLPLATHEDASRVLQLLPSLSSLARS